MANWKDMIAGCFGSADKIFSGHPLDQERAIDLLSNTCRVGSNDITIFCCNILNDI